MIHVTLKDGTVLLFDPDEKIWVCDEILERDEDDDKYVIVDGYRRSRAKNVLEAGMIFLERDSFGFIDRFPSPISFVREYPDTLPTTRDARKPTWQPS